MIRQPAVRCVALLLVLLSSTSFAPALRAQPVPDDPYLWLEDVTSEKALAWAQERSAEAMAELGGTPLYRKLEDRFLTILDSREKIPYVAKIGDYYYNFWKDKEHERGVWRRTTLEEYRKAAPAWETVIDLDALGKTESESWVWHGAQALAPGYERCLVSLSRGGADADVVREFDLGTKSFVAGGFGLPESKSGLAWRDKDTVYLAAAFDSTTMTRSGYPRVVREWRRGTPMESASPVFEGTRDDVGVGAYRDHTPGFERDFVVRSITTFTSEVFLRRDGKLIRIEKPDDARFDVDREWMFLTLRTDWTAGGRTWPAGALLATRFDDFMDGKRDFQMLFEPGERKSLAGYSATQHAVILNEMDNVKNRLYVLRPEGDRWTRTPFAGLPEFGRIDADAVDAYTSDAYFLTITDFLTPTSLNYGTVDGGPPERLKETPAFFDGSNVVVTQDEAVSADGTRIPYFLITPRNLPPGGKAPTVLYGYGGFEIPMTPQYSPTMGAGWLERGGVYALANIRGGGEFGPKWHQAGVKAGRHVVYEDFIAVAEALVKRGITDRGHLACMGGSNGGLLVGNMLTMRPDLFRAVVCQAPLLDMRRYNQLLAGASWMGEYGNPDDPSDWEFLREWSPYQNMKKDVTYPRTLFTASTRDDRVHPGHARKMVALMKDQGHDVLYYENTEGGHPGSATNKQRAAMSALAYTFLWKELAGAEALSVP